ncbi:OB-fold nucleic acid binding domain-containing protein, partial [Mesorhizobium sp.]
LGLSLKAHPVAFLRERLDRAGVIPNARLPAVPDGRRVSVAGLVLVRQRPGKGNAIFLTLEDENSVANVIFWERTFTRFRPIVMGARFVRVTGKLQSESGVIHIVAEKVEDLTPWLTVLLEEMPPALPAPPDIAVLSGKAESVMPKGRNFQ